MYLVCLLAWGLNFIAIKVQGHAVPLELSLLYRLAFTSVVFVVLTATLKPGGKPAPKDWGYLAAFGVLNLSLSYLLLYYATTWISAALVTLVFSLKTIGTPVALRIFLKQRLHPSVLVGGMVGICGVGLVLYPMLQQTLDDAALKGLSFAVLGMLLTSVGDACSARNARQGIHPLHANAFGFCVASVLLAAVCALQGRHWQFDTSVHYVGALLYLTLVASCLAWLFYLKLVERIGAAASSYMVALFPAVGGIGSVIIGDAEPSIYLLSGCVVSCAGAAIALGGSRFSRMFSR
jgi:drug/metabolite transporter (DMT)-like permease